jgi:uncharacterized membrane protein YfcA
MTELLIAATIAFSFFIQSTFGFGGGLIAIPLLTLLVGAKAAVTIVMIFQFLMGVQLFRLHKHISRGILVRLMPGLVLGLAAGLLIFSSVGEKYISTLLAAYIGLYALGEFLNVRVMTRVGSFVPVRAKSSVAGFFCGLVQGIAGTGGPSIIPYLKENTASVAEFRATVTAVLFFLNLLRMISAGALHAIDADVLRHVLVASPFFAVALAAGYRVPEFISRKTAHFIIDLILLAAAASIFIKLI